MTDTESHSLDDLPRLWTAEDVAKILRCDPRTVRRKTRTEGLPFVRTASNRMLFEPGKVRDWIDARRVVVTRAAETPGTSDAGRGRGAGAGQASPLSCWDGTRRVGGRRRVGR